MSTRIKGQETTAIFIQDGSPVTSISDITDHSFTYELEIKEEGYIGETSDRYDTIYKGIKGKMGLHFESAQVFTMFAAVLDKAARRVPGTTWNLKTTLNFGDGSRARVILKDVSFGAIPVTFGSRTDYGKIELEYACSEARTIVA